MPIVVGTAGHIDHGKTTLLRALTGIDADRLPEERRRGMTIDVGYAHAELAAGTSIDFVDVPGHDRLVGNMLVGAGEIDAALLVVAADDGPRAQTIEHLELLDALGIGHGLLAITKLDLVAADRTRATEVAQAVRDLLAGSSLEEVATVAVSAATGEGLDALRHELERLVDRVDSERTASAPPSGALPEPPRSRLAVDRAFAVRGRGTVVTGTLRGGDIAPGRLLRLLPEGAEVRVREVQVHGEGVERAGPGRAALNVAGVDVQALRRGSCLTDDPAVVATDRLLVALRPSLGSRRAPGDDRPAAAGRSEVRLHIGTDQVDARIERSARWDVEASDLQRLAVLRLARPIAAAPGERFVLRRPSPPSTLAGGRVLDPLPPRGPSRRRATPARLRALAEAPVPSPVDLLELHGALDLRRWRELGGTGRPGAGALVLAPDVLESLSRAAVGQVVAHHDARPDSAGIALVDLRASLARELRRLAFATPQGAATAAAAVIDALVAAGRLARSGDTIRDSRRPLAVPAALATAMDRLEAVLSTPSPPPFRAAVAASACPVEGVRRLEAAGRIVRLGPDLAFASATYRELEALALSMADDGPLTPAAFRDATSSSRRYVLAILEDLDRRGLLVRTPDGHRRASGVSR